MLGAFEACRLCLGFQDLLVVRGLGRLNMCRFRVLRLWDWSSGVHEQM